jgi:hypothetical protein
MSLLAAKRCTSVSSVADDERHTRFCYCGREFTVLEEVREAD